MNGQPQSISHIELGERQKRDSQIAPHAFLQSIAYPSVTFSFWRTTLILVDAAFFRLKWLAGDVNFCLRNL
jgi:hypothetical protein